MSGAVLVSVAGRSTFSRVVARPAEGDEAQASGSMQNPHPAERAAPLMSSLHRSDRAKAGDWLTPAGQVFLSAPGPASLSAAARAPWWPSHAMRGSSPPVAPIPIGLFDGKLRCLQASVSFESLKLH